MSSQFEAIPPLAECSTGGTCPRPAEPVSSFRPASNAAWSFTRSVNAFLPNAQSPWPSWAPEGPISPRLVGAGLLPLAVAPTLDGAFGCRGDLRFLQFGYPAGRQFSYSEGGKICRRTWVCAPGFSPIQSSLRTCPRVDIPTSYGRFACKTERPVLDQTIRSGFASPVCHCLHLAGRDGRAYVC